LVTRVADFALASIDGQLLAAAQTDPGAFIDGAELMIDAAFQTAVNRLASAMFRNGAGTIGQLLSTVNVSGNIYTCTLTNPDDAVQFEIGQVIVAVQNVDGSGTAPTDVATITAVNRNTGALTVTCSTTSSPIGRQLITWQSKAIFQARPTTTFSLTVPLEPIAY
jgi:hypothetical protein